MRSDGAHHTLTHTAPAPQPQTAFCTAPAYTATHEVASSKLTQTGSRPTLRSYPQGCGVFNWAHAARNALLPVKDCPVAYLHRTSLQPMRTAVSLHKLVASTHTPQPRFFVSTQGTRHLPHDRHMAYASRGRRVCHDRVCTPQRPHRPQRLSLTSHPSASARNSLFNRTRDMPIKPQLHSGSTGNHHDLPTTRPRRHPSLPAATAIDISAMYQYYALLLLGNQAPRPPPPLHNAASARGRRAPIPHPLLARVRDPAYQLPQPNAATRSPPAAFLLLQLHSHPLLRRRPQILEHLPHRRVPPQRLPPRPQPWVCRIHSAHAPPSLQPLTSFHQP